MLCPKTKKKVKNKKRIKRSSKQKRKYSGKKKCHTNKMQIVEDTDSKRIICLHFAKGSCHDFKLYKKSNLKIHPNIKVKVDKGYMGIKKIHANSDIPKKGSKNHKLTKTDKQNNKNLAKERIGIEHLNKRMKQFKILKYTYRNHSKFGLRATLIAIFYNALITV